jgi:biotin carboxyl carrier protein
VSTTSTDPRRRRHARHRGAQAPAVVVAPAAGPPSVPRPDVDSADAVETELAQPIRVIPARIWAAVAAIAVLVAGGLTWAMAGTWPPQLTTAAIVAHGSGPQLARAGVAGSVLDVTVRTGQPVRAGQPVATIAADDGTRETLRAPADGTVAAVLAPAGTAVRAGTDVVSVDVTAAAPTAALIVADPGQLDRLAAGQQVRIDADGVLLIGRVADAQPVRTSIAAVAAELTVGGLEGTVGLAGVPPTTPVWRVAVELDPGQQIAGTGAARAVVELPAVPVYQLITGLDQ